MCSLHVVILTLSSPVRPFGIIFLYSSYATILGGWKGFPATILGGWKPFPAQKIVAFFGMQRVNPFPPPNIVAYERQN
jgi:hypothetical protein